MLRAQGTCPALVWSVLAAFGIAVFSTAAQAQTEETTDLKLPEPGDKKAAPAKEEKPDFPPFEEVAKDHKPVPAPEGSFWTLYYDKEKDSLLAEIPGNKLDRNFLVATSISSGPQFTNYMWGDSLVQWQEFNKKLVLVEPDVRYKPGSDSEVGDVIKRTYSDSIVLSTPIVTKNNGNPVISLDAVLKSDFAGIGRIFGGSIDSSLSKYAKKKVFPKNLELSVELAIMSGNSGGTKAAVHYSISELPETDYKPREADDRVGYFLTAVKDWTRPHNDKTIFRRLIHRWRLRKENANAAVSDVNPDDQIVFYIEKTVPKQYRRYVREGILEWNKAFEKAGLRNAIQVRQQTDNTFADIDPEDVRYNFFRWIVSGRAFARGPSRANPLTGQILDADIIMDDSMIRVWEARYAQLAALGPAASYDPALAEFLRQHPQWNFHSISQALQPTGYSVSGVETGWDHETIELLEEMGHSQCSYANGVAHEIALGHAFLAATGNLADREKFIGQSIKSVTIHEVGHTLGLRHNFKASTWKSMDEIMKTRDEDVPVSASVMDYNPSMFALEAEDQGVYLTTVVGPYDYWAIEYGYRLTDEEHSDEAELLKQIASRSAEPGHAYATDEDTTSLSPDPLVNRFDNGSDPLDYTRQRIAMANKLLGNIEEWALEDGESYNRLRKAFDMLLFEINRSSQFTARYVGGMYVNRDHKGDPNARMPFEVVPAAKQREALGYLVDNIFSDKSFQFKPELINKLGAGRWGHWDSDAFDSSIDYPIHERIEATQYWSMFQVLNPFTLSRVYDAEMKVPAGQETITVPELMASVARAVWSELLAAPDKNFTNRDPYISSIRRTLQRRHLELMIDVVLGEPGRIMPADAHAVARMTLKGISQQIDDVLTNAKAESLDAFTRAHLDESKVRIDKALDAQFSL